MILPIGADADQYSISLKEIGGRNELMRKRNVNVVYVPESFPSSWTAVNWAALLLEILAGCEDRGAWDSVELFLDKSDFPQLIKSATPKLLAEIEGYRRKLATAREYEKVHGRGSLYKRDHPFNIWVAAILADIELA